MDPGRKTKKQLEEELSILRQRVTVLEGCEAQSQQSKRDVQNINARLIIDITERKQPEEALRRAHTDLEQPVADRTAELVAKNRQLIRAVQEHRRAERALRQSKEKYRGIVDNIGIGISLISPGMEILTLSEQMKRWFPDIEISQRPICYKALNNATKYRLCIMGL